MKFAAPRDNDVFPEVFPGSCLGNFEADDSHSKVLKRLQPKQDLAHPVDLRTIRVIRTQKMAMA
jgi:hypothetical protein